MYWPSVNNTLCFAVCLQKRRTEKKRTIPFVIQISADCAAFAILNDHDMLSTMEAVGIGQAHVT